MLSAMSAPQERVPLTRACSQCIKAKRKCSRGLPRCQRCTKQDILCRYKNAPLVTTPPRSLASTTNIVESSRPQPHDTNLVSCGASPGPISYDLLMSRSLVDGSSSIVSSPEPTTSSLSYTQLAPPDVVMTLDQPTLDYLSNHLRGFTTMFARSAGNIFIHRELYPDGLPPQLQNMFMLCCTHVQLNQTNYPIVSQAIASAANALVSSVASAHTFLSLLELLQSLILLQIITLLYPSTNLSLRKQAESRMTLLSSLTMKLFRSVPSYLPASLTPYQAWILAESVRRTIHVAHKVRAVHSVMTRSIFVLTAFVETLPLNQKSFAWDFGVPVMQDRGGVEVVDEKTSLETDLISYRQLVDKWEVGEVKQPGLFEEILIVACKGASCVLQSEEK